MHKITKKFVPNTVSIEKFWRAANYISAGMLYLKENVLLKHPLKQTYFKRHIIGHWGTSPGVNAVYAHVNNLIRRTEQPIRLIVGTGHAGPAILANLFLEGTLAEYYEKYPLNELGLKNLFTDFGCDGGWDTEISPEYPGMLYAGGELGAALAFAQGCTFNSKDSFTVCLIGDGELETSITQGSWQGFQFLNPIKDGFVLPVINANGNKMGSVSLLSLLNKDEKTAFFRGQGLTPIFAGTDHNEIAKAFNTAYTLLTSSKKNYGEIQQPVIIMETPKGWTAPDVFGGKAFAGTHKSHKPILKLPSTDIEQANMVWDWLKSYKIQELFDENGVPLNEVISCLPKPKMRLGRHLFESTYRNSRKVKAVRVPTSESGHQHNAGAVEKAIFSLFSEHSDLLVFCPDEISSNQMSELLKYNGMKFGKSLEGTNKMHPSGRVVEILNEHLCFAWAQGYAAAGCRSVLISYEAFAPIFDSMAAQYIKFLKRSKFVSWRKKTPSINIILTSLGWRNCATHHNPGFADGLLGRNLDNLRIYMPVSSDSSELYLEQMLNSFDCLNVMIISKHDLPRLNACISKNESPAISESWLILEREGNASCEISLIAIGDNMAEECLHAKDILSKENPGLSVQVIAIQELSLLERKGKHRDTLLNVIKNSLSTVWAYNGYPKTIQAFLWNAPVTNMHKVIGYRDKGRSSAGVRRYIENDASRYHIVLEAVDSIHTDSFYDCSETIKKCKKSISSFN